MSEKMVTVPRDLVLLALSFAPGDPVPEGLNPMFYHTLTHAGDLEIVTKLGRLRELVKASE